MARRPIVEREEVLETANRLAAEGKDVTALALLNALGGGSLTTIYRYLDAWKSSRPVTTRTVAAEIPDVVQNAFAHTWRVATVEAAREVEVVKEKAAEDVRVAQKEFASALEAIERLEAESEAEAVKISGLEERTSELEASLQKASNDNAAAQATIEQLEQRLKAQEVELERVRKEAEAERQRHQEEVERAGKEREAAVKEAAALQGQVEALKGQNSELLSKLSERKEKR